MTNRSAFLLVAVVAASLWGCGSVTTATVDGSADLVDDQLDAAPSEANAENHSDGAAAEVLPEVGPEAPPAIPACAAAPMQPLTACARAGCALCLGSHFETLAPAGGLCAAAGVVCAADCALCP